MQHRDSRTPQALAMTRRLVLSLGCLPLAGCSAVGAFNALAPADGGARLAASGLPYGELPRQRLDIYAPPGAAGLPAVLFLYGGGWNSGSRADYGFAGRAVAARGCVVAVADYRLVPEVRYPAFLEDCALALRWLRDNAATYGGDARKLFVMGHSAGGYNALMLALDPSLARGAGLRGQVLRGAIGLAGPYDFLPLDVSESQEAFGRAPDLARTQPVNHATGFAPPVFLATGADDTVVYPRNATGLAGKLRAAGRPAELHVYPGIGHAGLLTALSPPFRARAPVLDDVARFIAMHSAA